MKVILPKTLPAEALDPAHPVFFLAGPVRGGGDWQHEVCKEIQRQRPGAAFYVAIPYYHATMPADHPLVALRMPGDEHYFPRQLNWERHYLEMSSKTGCLIFWLPAESKTSPRDPAGGPYATDTRGELGEWRGRLMHDPSLRVVVGGEDEFVSFSQIERNFKLAVRDDFPIYRSLKETVAAAIEKAWPNEIPT